MSNSAKIEVSTSEYEFSHGKKPRGFGTWAFEIGPGRGVEFIGGKTFTEAKKAAVVIAKSRGVRAIVVCP